MKKKFSFRSILYSLQHDGEICKTFFQRFGKRKTGYEIGISGEEKIRSPFVVPYNAIKDDQILSVNYRYRWLTVRPTHNCRYPAFKGPRKFVPPGSLLIFRPFADAPRVWPSFGVHEVRIKSRIFSRAGCSQLSGTPYGRRVLPLRKKTVKVGQDASPRSVMNFHKRISSETNNRAPGQWCRWFKWHTLNENNHSRTSIVRTNKAMNAKESIIFE